jgi:hypothetical protein
MPSMPLPARANTLLAPLLLAFPVTLFGCVNEAGKCERTLTCPEVDALLPASSGGAGGSSPVPVADGGRAATTDCSRIPCGAGQVCNLATGACVGCLENNDCESAKVCNRATGKCVACLGDNDCSTPSPYCNTVRDACEQCRVDADCPVTAPACNTGVGSCASCSSEAACNNKTRNGLAAPVCALNGTLAGQCVPCTGDRDCPSPDAPHCDLNATSSTAFQCIGCVADVNCANKVRNNVPLNVCATAGERQGQCVQCTGANDSACGNIVCDVVQNRCSDQMPGSAGRCEACVSTDQCTTTNVCADDPVQVGIQYRCVPLVVSGACPDPFVNAAFATDIEGAENVAVCQLRGASCLAFTQFGNACIGSNDTSCGIDATDAVCLPVPLGGFQCTKGCGTANDCVKNSFQSASCDAPGFCSLPLQ